MTFFLPSELPAACNEFHNNSRLTGRFQNVSMHLLLVSALGAAKHAPTVLWPTSNDSLSIQLSHAQRTIRSGYAAHRAAFVLDPTGEQLAAAASSWAAQVLESVPLADALQGLLAHMASVHMFSVATLPPRVRA